MERGLATMLAVSMAMAPHAVPSDITHVPNRLKGWRPSQRRPDGYTTDDKGTATKDHNIGRNEPCPCGSGKKYKKCHGR